MEIASFRVGVGGRAPRIGLLQYAPTKLLGTLRMMGEKITRPFHKRLRTLQIESLSPRLTLDGTASASAAIPWLSLGGLTYSFVPDGTSLADRPSSLYAELASTGSVEQWQAAFEQAFREWLHPLGTDITQVADGGQPFGTFGPTQGDSRFGDIRIGAVPLSDNVMAEAVPHSVISQGTWAGDILLNANAEWTNLQQVLSVALHEIGHVLGVGHSNAPDSPMFFHGASGATRPTANDIAQLQRLYAGVDVNTDTDEHHENATDAWRERPQFRFAVAEAIALPAIVGTTIRYASSGALNLQSTSALYRLEAVGDIDHAEFMNVVVKASKQDGLIPDVAMYDQSGDPLPFHVLSNSNGTKVIQVRDVEPNQSYYIAVTPTAGPARYQVGAFEIFAAYSLKALEPTEVGVIALDSTHPIAEQVFSISTSRLVHLLVASQATDANEKIPVDSAAVWATLLRNNGETVAKVAMLPGDTRSAPLVMLEPGNYRIVFESGSRNGVVSAINLSVFLDEISIDVGIGTVDATSQPMLVCGSPGADPAACATPAPPINAGGPIYPIQPNPPGPQVYPSPPWTSPSWHYWPATVAPQFLQNIQNRWDVSGDNLVSPLDALLVINLLNNQRSVLLSTNGLFYDTSGDGNASPLDALLVINALNSSRFSPAGEGESTSPPSSFDAMLNEYEELRRKSRTQP